MVGEGQGSNLVSKTSCLPSRAYVPFCRKEGIAAVLTGPCGLGKKVGQRLQGRLLHSLFPKHILPTYSTPTLSSPKPPYPDLEPESLKEPSPRTLS